ncbi:MAG: endo alpha-1,4 polygalactosaminidase [Solirubrobacterales bacterium]
MSSKPAPVRMLSPLLSALAALVVLAALLGPMAEAGAAAGRGASAACARHGERHRARWHPPASTRPWQWQLQGEIDTSVPACVYDVDGFETSGRTVAELHRKHVKVICYLDVGSWESYRPDRAEFPRSVIGRKYEGFPDERWLDVSRFHLFAKPLEQRFEMCARKGFDAVEPDNIQGWEPENKTGFKITRADQLRFNRWVARQVHGRGMSVALKNDGRQARQLLPQFDFAVVEECFQYDECGYYRPFIRANKAVFETEYEQQPKQYCKAALALGFSSIRKSYDLFAKPWIPCRRL